MNIETSEKVCNFCGKKFDMWDELQNANITHDFLYGSKHDGEKLRCYMCCECLDELVDKYILKNSTINPIE